VTKFADLHIHTNYSDGVQSPQQVVEDSLSCGLSCIAITDHDTVEGIQPTMDAAKGRDLEVIVGIEFSTEIHDRDVHILGYLFDRKNEKISEGISLFQNARLRRIEKMIQKLEALGIDNIKPEEVFALAKSDSVGRPHLAALLIEKGWVKDMRTAFGKYLGENGPAYVPKYKQTPYEAIALIRQAGGVAVLAHPMITNKDELIPSFMEAGLVGIEVYYPNCARNVIEYYEGIAKKNGLIMTGGSDSHGDFKDNTFIGKAMVPYKIVEQLREKCPGKTT